MSGAIEQFTRDALAARGGDLTAKARLARRAVPWALKRAMPALAPLVDVGCGLYDELVKPEAKPAPADGNYTSPGARAFTTWLRARQHGIFLIVGAPGTGKTTLACRISDNWSASHKYIVGVSRSALANTPLEPFNLTAQAVARLPFDSVLIIPDAGLYLDSREYGTNQEDVIRKLATIVRHRRVRIILDFQYTSLVAKSVFLADCIFYRPLGVTWAATEREGLMKLARAAQHAWADIPPEERLNWVYAVCDAAAFMGFVRAGVPDWYHDGISVAHADDDALGIVDGEYEVLE